jgi:hypothetical protein
MKLVLIRLTEILAADLEHGSIAKALQQCSGNAMNVSLHASVTGWLVQWPQTADGFPFANFLRIEPSTLVHKDMTTITTW